MNSSQQSLFTERLRQGKLRRKDLGEPPLTPEEEAAMKQQFQQDVADTAQKEANLSEIGSVRTDNKGSRVISGDYKGMTPAAARQAALTSGPPPRPGTGAPDRGRSEWKTLNPNHLLPSEQGRPGPMFPPVVVPPTAAPPPPPSGGQMPSLPTPPVSPGLAADVQGQSVLTPQAGMPAAPTSAPPVDPAKQRALEHQQSVDLANGLRDAKQGVVESGPGGIKWNNGAAVYNTGNGRKDLASPYGTGSSVMPAAPAANVAQQQPAPAPTAAPPAPPTSDPRLQAKIASLQQEQAANPGLPKKAANDIGHILAAGPPTPGATTVIGRIKAGQPMLPSASPAAPAKPAAAPPPRPALPLVMR